MATRSRAIPVLLLIGSVAASAALFLNFTFNVSPLAGLLDGEDGVWMLAAPFFLAPVVGVLAAWWLVVGDLPLAARRLGYLTSLGAIAITAGFCVRSALDRTNEHTLAQWTPEILAGVVALAGLWLFRRAQAQQAEPEVRSLTVLTFGYLANAVLCLMAFAGDWQVGAYVSLAAVAVYGLAAGRLAMLRPAVA